MSSEIQQEVPNGTESKCVTVAIDNNGVEEEVATSGSLTHSTESNQSTSATSPLKRRFYHFIRQILWAFPLIVVFMLPFLCFITYFLSVHYNQVYPILPYVSDSGGNPPQAGFFSQYLDIVAFGFVSTAFIRYKQFKYFIQTKMPSIDSKKYNTKKLQQLNKINFISLINCYVIGIGTVMIGNFRVTETPSMHFTGVMFAFFGMFTYTIMMNYLTNQMHECKLETKPISMVVIFVTLTVVFTGTFIFSAISILQFGFKRFFINEDRLNWRKHNAGYVWHVLGTFCEWLTINLVSPYYFCLFRRIYAFRDWDKVIF